MIEELEGSLEAYQKTWQKLVEDRHETEYFSDLKPIAAGWKVADKVQFDECFAQLFIVADRVHCSWIDERWLASFHLRSPLAPWNIRIVKLMQRRPGVSDALGLDHVDFLVPAHTTTEDVLAREPGVTWTHEHGDVTSWISLWFAGTEAKLRTPNQTSVDAALREWHVIHQEITKR